MPKRNLTDAFVKSAKPVNGKQVEYSDTKERGLILRVTGTGAKSWTFRYRNNAGNQRRITLGNTDTVPLASARAMIVKHRQAIASGADPSSNAKAARLKETIKEVGKWYFQECAKGRHRPNLKRPKRKSTIDLEQYYFDKHIVPEFGNVKIDTLTRADIQSFIDRLADKQSASAARQCRIILHAVFAFSQRHELTDKNPVQFVTVAAQKARERILTDSELKALWLALTAPVEAATVPVGSSVALTILLAMVTLQRRGEVTGMSVAELDLERRLWVIPSHRTKNHRSHAVPLSELAMELIGKALAIRDCESEFVFPSPRDTDKPIKPAALTRAFGRIRKALDLGDIRPHDLRRTGATNLTSEHLGFARFTVSKVLNHTSDTGGAAAVTGIYDQNEYLSEKRRALGAWALRLLEIVEGTATPDNVVKFKA